MERYERLLTSNKELQKFRRLDKTLSNVVLKEDSNGLALTGKTLKNVLNAWFFQVAQIFNVSSGTLKYFDRAETPEFNIDYKSQFDWIDHLDQDLYSSFIAEKTQFLVDLNIIIFKFQLPTQGFVIGAYTREAKTPKQRKAKAFKETELGVFGEYIHLLNERLEFCRRWDIERWKSKILSRKTMLKELRPKSLFYNLLYIAQRITSANYSFTILTPDDNDKTNLVISAELIRFSKLKSRRIESKLSLDSNTLEYLKEINNFKIINLLSNSDNLIELNLISLLYSSFNVPLPNSLLLIPLKYKENHDCTLIAFILIADNRELFFKPEDGSYISTVVNAASPIIYNSLHFGHRLEKFTKELETQLISDLIWEENIHKISKLIKRHFSAKLCQICIFESNQLGKFSNFLGDIQRSSLSNGKIEEFQFISQQSAFLTTLLFQREMFISKNLSNIENFEFPNIIKHYKVNSVIAAPVIFNKQLLGFICCYFEGTRNFSRFEHYQLESASQQIGAVVAYKARTNQQLNDLTRVLSIMERLSSIDDDQLVREKLIAETKDFLQADYCFISIPDETGKGLITNAKTWGNEFDIPIIKITGKLGDGITSYVAKNQELYLTNDVSKDEYYKDINHFSPKPIKIKSEMAAPLMVQNKLIGVLDVMSSRKKAFSPREKTLLQMLLNQSSLAIENARAVREKRDHINIINDLQLRLIDLNVPEKIYLMILQTAIDYISQFHIDAQILGNLYIKSPRSRYLEVKAFIGEKSESFLPIQYIGEGVVGHVAKTGIGLIIRNTSRPPAKLKYQPFIKGIKNGSEISIPLKVGSEVNSVINLESPSKGLFSEKDLQILNALASEISIGVKFAQLYEELYKKQERKFYEHEGKYLRVLSHEVMRSAKNTAAHLPKLKKRIRNDTTSLGILEQIAHEVQKTLTAENELLRYAIWKDFSSIDVIATLNKVVTFYSTKYKKVKFCNFIQTSEFFIDGNEELLTYVFVNLIRNSCDAMQKTGKITIEEIPSNSPTNFTLLFSDTGSGIRADIEDKIWDLFFSDDGHGKSKGLGFGLWFVKDFVERMNGKIMVVDSKPFKRTTFMITFDIKDSF